MKPTHRITSKTKLEDVSHEHETEEQKHWRHLRHKMKTGEDYWVHLPSIPSVRRVHVRPREQLWHPEEAVATCPFPLEDLSGDRYTLMTRVSDGLIAEKSDDFRDSVASELEEMNGEPWTGYTEFTLHDRCRGEPERYIYRGHPVPAGW